MDNQKPNIAQLLLDNIKFLPTPDQKRAIELLILFLGSWDKNIYLLKGYAGTGKTTLIAALVKTSAHIQQNTVLMAPTGRAAKVMSSYADKPAFTIHKIIYKVVQASDGSRRMILQKNKLKNTIFIVDEASMITSEMGISSYNWGAQKSLLDDLMTFVYSGENCKVLFSGDTAQLPPVGMNLSNALSKIFLFENYHIEVFEYELKEVVRQPEASGILANATRIRYNIEKDEVKNLHFNLRDYDDIEAITGEFLEDELNSAYNNFGDENVIVVTRSNKRANLFNQQIRTRIRWLEEEITAGDYMMVVKNNYFWLDEQSQAGFIANGDIVEIMQITGFEEMYGFRFATVNIRMIDYPKQPEIEVKMLLDSISADGPSINSEAQSKLYYTVAEDYADIPNKQTRREKIRKNPYYNALQVKFSYAVTCHKSQGGQWDAVFIDQGYLTEEMINTEYLRWLYTAVTRAKLKLYLVNFHSSFLSQE